MIGGALKGLVGKIVGVNVLGHRFKLTIGRLMPGVNAPWLTRIVGVGGRWYEFRLVARYTLGFVYLKPLGSRS